MRHYEVMVVLAPDLAEDGFNKHLEKFKKIIENGGGSIVNDDRWGIRSLAYPIKKYDQGFYTVIEWESTPDLLPELDHILRLDENVLRHMVVYLDSTALEGAAQVRAKRAEATPVNESVASDDSGDGDIVTPDDSGEVEADAEPEPEAEESSDPDASGEADPDDSGEVEADAEPEPEAEESSDPDASGEADPDDSEEVEADAEPEPEAEESSDPDASGEADPGDTEEVDAEKAEEEK